MNSRAFQFQLQAAEASASASPVHAAGDDELEATQKVLLLELKAQGTADEPAASRQGSVIAPMGIPNADATKCPECPKWFASEKAMFGHLRKHPERGYKGATRPTTVSAAAAAAAAGDKKSKKVPRKEVDVPAMNMAADAAVAAGGKKPRVETELSTKLPVPAKRGRTPVASSCSEEEEAAMILLEMASSSRTSSETLQQSVQPAVRAPDSVSGHQLMPGVEQPMLLDHVAGHQTKETEQIVQSENALELSEESQTPAVKQVVTELEITTETVVIVVPANKPIFPSLDSGAGDKKIEMPQVVMNLEQTAASPPPPEGAVRAPPARRIPSPASDKKHECQTCGKSFPTHQALGGHASSHVKVKTSARHDDLAAAQATHNILALAHRVQNAGNVIITASSGAGAFQEHHNAQPPPVQSQVLTLTPPTKPQSMAQAAQHVCGECFLIFPSGQALGGHKRKHWFPEKYQAKTTPVPVTVPVPEPRDFDLNEPPKEGQGENNQP